MKIKFKPPTTNWNQLNDWQLNRLALILFSNDSINHFEVEIEVMITLFLEKPTFKNILKFIVLIFTMDWPTLKESTQFIFEDYNLDRFKDHKIKGVNLYGPSVRLRNMLMEEFIMADKLYFDYATASESQKPLMLERLVGCLYRPSGEGSTNTDRRRSFSVENMEAIAPITSQIPKHEQILIALAYKNSRDKLIERFPLVFPKTKKSSAKTPKKPKYHSFKNLVETMAFHENAPLGNIHQILKTNINTFFDSFSTSVKRFKELEKQRNYAK